MEFLIRKLFALILFCLVSERKIRVYKFFENIIILGTAERSAVFFLLSIGGEPDGKRINGIRVEFPRMLRKQGGCGMFWI